MISKKTVKIKTKNLRGNARIFIFCAFMLAAVVAVSYRLFNLTYVQHEAFAKTAKFQQQVPTALLAGRGSIFVFDYSNSTKKIAASNRTSYYTYTTDGGYKVLSRGLTKEQAQAVKNSKIEGIGVATEISRFYSKGAMAAHVFGFVGYEGNDRTGQYGIEAYYDDYLNGQNRTLQVSGNKTYASLWKLVSNNDDIPNDQEQDTEGSDIVLTIDPNIQLYIETKLNEILKKYSAEGGSVIIQNPQTGAILAMASSPSFDPNNYSVFGLDTFTNPVVQDYFEPGSSFKAFTMAAGLDSKAITPETKYEDKGFVEISGYTIKNYNEKSYGTITLRNALFHSLNTGSMFAETKTGDDAFLKYVVSFGFGQKTGIDLAGELSGAINNLYGGRKINFLTASFGQGIAVTPIQLINAYSSIANGGKLLRPYVVKEIIHADTSSERIQTEIIDVPISEATSQQLTSMLVGVSDTVTAARVPGYEIAVKTGTAQIADKKGGYIPDQVIHNIVGYAPANNPKFTLLIKMNRPKGVKFSTDSLAPMFADISRFLLRYFNVPPSK